MRAIELLGFLNEPERSQALANINADRKDIDQNTISGALHFGFTWKETKQGFLYWEDIYYKLQEKKYIFCNPMFCNEGYSSKIQPVGASDINNKYELF